MGNSFCCSNEYCNRKPNDPRLCRETCCSGDKPIEHTKVLSKKGDRSQPAEVFGTFITNDRTGRQDLTADAAAHESAVLDQHMRVHVDDPIVKLELALELATARLELATAQEQARSSQGTGVLIHLEIQQEIDKLAAVKDKLDKMRVQTNTGHFVERDRLLGKLQDAEMQNGVLEVVADCNASAAADYKNAMLTAQANVAAAEAETRRDTAMISAAMDALEAVREDLKKEEARAAALEQRLDSVILLKLASDLELAKLTSTEFSKFRLLGTPPKSPQQLAAVAKAEEATAAAEAAIKVKAAQKATEIEAAGALVEFSTEAALRSASKLTEQPADASLRDFSPEKRASDARAAAIAQTAGEIEAAFAGLQETTPQSSSLAVMRANIIQQVQQQAEVEKLRVTAADAVSDQQPATPSSSGIGCAHCMRSSSYSMLTGRRVCSHHNSLIYVNPRTEIANTAQPLAL